MVRRVGSALYAGGQIIETEAELSIMAGAVSGKGHIASLPGEAPNNDTTTLVNNIETVLVAPLKVEVSSNAPYAAALEFGTSRMGERPYMRPAVAKKRREATRLVRSAVDHVIRHSKGV